MASIYSDEYQMVIKKLRDTRIQKGMTQAMLAKCLGRPQSFIAKIENGERRIDVVEFAHIANLLLVDPSAILDRIINKKHDDKPMR